MSLDVWLEDENGHEVFSANVTHNLRKMADEAGIYKCLWRPDENGMTKAHQIIEPLNSGVIQMATESARFKLLDSPNGWGKYENFLPWCAIYLQACKDNPEAIIKVSR